MLAGEYVTPPFLSREAKDVLRKLLMTDPTRRATLEQASGHAWCAIAANAVVHPCSAAAGPVAQLAAEAVPDTSTLKQMEASHGYSALAVAKHLAEGKPSEASATYSLLRLRVLRGVANLPVAPGTSASQSVRTAQAVVEHPRSIRSLSARDQRRNGLNMPTGKENECSAPLPHEQKVYLRGGSKVPLAIHGQPQSDAPTKKRSRSPKPLTLLSKPVEIDPREAHRSSPGLFKSCKQAPAGAAHEAVRANRGDDRLDFCERVHEIRPVADEQARRPSSARRGCGVMRHCRADIVPAPPTTRAHCPSPRAVSLHDQPRQRGGEFRQRKYRM